MERILRTSALALGLATLLGACLSEVTPPSTQVGQAVAGFLNASAVKVDVEVDFVVMLSGIEPSMPAALEDLFLAPGTHFIRIRQTGTTSGGAGFNLLAEEGKRRNFISYQTPGQTPGSAAISARLLEDTGAVVPAGKSKVRVVNLAPGSDIDIWRTQPDFQQATRFSFPFPFNPEPGPYFQSDAGAWTVWITSTSDPNVRLHEVGPINIISGDKRTIAVVDSSGVLRLRVLRD
jgi:hypothetical protein